MTHDQSKAAIQSATVNQPDPKRTYTPMEQAIAAYMAHVRQLRALSDENKDADRTDQRVTRDHGA